MVKIRLARRGRVHRPIYNIVAADSRKPRDGRYLEKLGVYDPSAETQLFNIESDKIKAWIDKGAALSDTVRTVLKKNKIEL